MPLRIVFFGSDAVALPTLEWLKGEGAAVASVAAVFTGPDRPAGRGQAVGPNPIKAWALANGVETFQPPKPDEQARLHLQSLGADLSLVMAYGHLLSDAIISVPRLGTLNLHASILPSFRGASPIQTSIACAQTETGVSLMRIVRALDAGPVADCERLPIAALDTAAEIESALAKACVPLLARTFPRLSQGSLEFVPQDDARATYCRKLLKEDGALDFAVPAPALAARVNGLNPWPGIQVMIGSEPVKFGLAEALEGPSQAAPGTVIGQDDGLLIAGGFGVLRVLRLQRPGGRMLAAAEFLRGFPVKPGTVLASRPMPPLVSGKPFPRVRS